MARTARPRPASGGQPSRRPAALPRLTTGAPRRVGIGFFQDVISELKKVVWPTRQVTVRLSVVVVVVSAAIGVLLGAFDWAFSQVMQRFLVPPVTGF